jgi:hypothetical protein
VAQSANIYLNIIPKLTTTQPFDKTRAKMLEMYQTTQGKATVAMEALKNSLTDATNQLRVLPTPITDATNRLDSMAKSGMISAQSIGDNIRSLRALGKEHTDFVAPLNESAQRLGKFYTTVTAGTKEARANAINNVRKTGDSLKAELTRQGDAVNEFDKKTVNNLLTSLNSLSRRTRLTSEDIRGTAAQFTAASKTVGATFLPELKKADAALMGVGKTLSVVETRLTGGLRPSMRGVATDLKTSTRALVSMTPATAALTKEMDRLLTKGRLTPRDLEKPITLAERASLQLSKTFPAASRAITNMIVPLRQLSVELAGAEEEMKRSSQQTSIWRMHSLNMTKFLNVFSSVAAGTMAGFSALTGSIQGVLFSLIFMRFSMVGIFAITAALTLAIGGLVKSLTAISRAAIAVNDLRIQFDNLTGSVEKGARYMENAVQAAIDTGRSVSDASGALITLRRHGLLTADMWKAVQAISAGTGESLAKTAENIIRGVGDVAFHERAFIDATRDMGLEITGVTDGMRRQDVAMAIARAGTEKYSEAVYRNQKSISVLWGTLQTLTSQILATIGTPFVRDFLAPMLQWMVKTGKAVLDLVRAFMLSDGMQRLWIVTIGNFREALKTATPFLKELGIFLKHFLIGALTAGAILINLVSLAFKWLAQHSWLAASALAFFNRLLKPVWDGLGILANRLKNLNLNGLLDLVKKFAIAFPAFIRGAIAAVIRELEKMAGRLFVVPLKLFMDLDWAGFWKSLTNTLEELTVGVRRQLGKWVERFLIRMESFLLRLVNAGWARFSSAGKALASAIVRGIRLGLQNFSTLIEDALKLIDNTVVKSLRGVISRLSARVSNMASTVSRSIARGITGAMGRAGALMSMVEASARRLAADIVDAILRGIKGVPALLTQKLPSIPGMVMGWLGKQISILWRTPIYIPSSSPIYRFFQMLVDIMTADLRVAVPNLIRSTRALLGVLNEAYINAGQRVIISLLRLSRNLYVLVSGVLDNFFSSVLDLIKAAMTKELGPIELKLPKVDIKFPRFELPKIGIRFPKIEFANIEAAIINGLKEAFSKIGARLDAVLSKIILVDFNLSGKIASLIIGALEGAVQKIIAFDLQLSVKLSNKIMGELDRIPALLASELVEKFPDKLGEAIGQAFGKAGAKIGSLFERVVTASIDDVGNAIVKKSVPKIVAIVQRLFSTAFSSALKLITFPIGMLGTVLHTVLADIPGAIARGLLRVLNPVNIKSLLKGTLKLGAWGIVAVVAEAIGDALIEGLDVSAAMKDALKGALSGAILGLMIAPAALIPGVGPFIVLGTMLIGAILGGLVGRERLDELTNGLFTGIWNAIQNAVNKVGEFMDTLVVPNADSLMKKLGGLLKGFDTGDIDSIYVALSGLIPPQLAVHIYKLQELWDNLTLLFRENVLPVLEELGKNFNDFVATIAPLIGPAIENIVKFFGWMADRVGDFMGMMGEFIQRHSSQIIGIFKGMWKIAQGIFQIAFSIIRGIVEIFLALIGGKWEAAGEAWWRMIGGIWEGIQKIFFGALEIIANQFWLYVTTLGEIAGKIGGAIMDGLGNALSGLGDFLQRVLIEAAKKMVSVIPGLSWDPDKGFSFDPFGTGEKTTTGSGGSKVKSAGITPYAPAPAAPIVVNVQVSGNYILDDIQAGRLADQVAKQVTRRFKFATP